MSKLHTAARLLFMALVVAAVTACSGGGVKSDLGIRGAPDWVNKGTSALNEKGGRLFHGVGWASPMGDMALQKSAADDRARAEVARLLSSYLDVVSSDYMASVKPGTTSVSEEAVTRQIRNISQVNLAGARIIGSWRDPRTQIIYSIAELDMDQVKKMLAEVQGMNGDLRRYVEMRANNIFDSVAKEKK